MERIAFKMQLYKGQVEEYKKRHDQLWPELTQLLKENGINDYSIFLDEEAGNLIGVLKVESKRQLDTLASHTVMKKWWKYMSDIMHTHMDDSPISVPLKEIFYLH